MKKNKNKTKYIHICKYSIEKDIYIKTQYKYANK